MKYKVFIFDFDLTLVDATTGIVECVNYALEQAGLEPANSESIRKTVGMTLRDILYELTGIKDSTVADKFFSDFISKADEIMTENTILFDDTIDVLSRIKRDGYNVAVVTTKIRYRVDEILDKFDIHELFDYIIGLEDVENVKPSPEGILKVIDFFGYDKDSVLFIGDTLIDANAAANASVDFAAVLTGATEKEKFLDLPHVYIADNLTELFEHVYKI